ncbi:MAG: enoyl-CoA hydratase/isomerase family protein [Gammaproteobacteria bacterium]
MNTSEYLNFSLIPGKGGNLGLIVLDRPRALNALDEAMIKNLAEQLNTWQQDPHIKAVVIQSSHEKAFCAGGDVRAIYANKQRPHRELAQFFWHEYRLNRCIHHYSKPYIALLDGITMGGGVGISLHGSHPIASENINFAMPETTIGFYPDIGSSYLLSRCPYQFGLYLALTGNHLKLSDLFATGLIKYFIPKAKQQDFIETLAATDLGQQAKEASTILVKKFSETIPTTSSLNQYRSQINKYFHCSSIDALLEQLQTSTDPWCQQIFNTLKEKSPTSLKITLRQLQLAAQLDIDDCLKMDYRLTNRFLTNHDFYEGVRAALIDKDQTPQWQPATLTEVSEENIDEYFAPLTQELIF